MKFHLLPDRATGLLLASALFIYFQQEPKPTTPAQLVGTAKSERVGIFKQSTARAQSITYQQIVYELTTLKYYLPINNIALRLH